jgi:hydroxypyruvate isomerase
MNAPRVSANLGFLYAELPLADRIAAAAADGFDALELHWPYATGPSEVRAALAAACLPCLSLNTPPGDPEAGEFGLAALPGRTREARRAIDDAADYAAEAGIGAVHVMAGRAHGAEAERAFLDALDHAVRRAEASGLRLLVEPLNTRDVPGYFLAGTDHAARIVDRVGWSGLGIMYDFYHMQIMQGDHVARLRALGPRVFHHQIAAVPGRGEPDRGELDFPFLFGTGAVRADVVGAEYRPGEPPGDWLARFRAALRA